MAKMGETVFYHFRNQDDPLKDPEMRFRPAIVVDVEPDGKLELAVLFSKNDHPVNESLVEGAPLTAQWRHHVPMSEDGKPPEPGTWAPAL